MRVAATLGAKCKITYCIFKCIVWCAVCFRKKSVKIWLNPWNKTTFKAKKKRRPEAVPNKGTFTGWTITLKILFHWQSFHPLNVNRREGDWAGRRTFSHNYFSIRSGDDDQLTSVLTSRTSCGSVSILKITSSHKLKTKENKTKDCSGVQLHLFSMSVCTLWTKSLAIISTCGTSCRSAISDEGERKKRH